MLYCSAATLSPNTVCLGKGFRFRFGEGVGVGCVCGVWAVSGCCLRDPVCCQGVIVSKQVEKGQLALHCSAETTL